MSSLLRRDVVRSAARDLGERSVTVDGGCRAVRRREEGGGLDPARVGRWGHRRRGHTPRRRCRRWRGVEKPCTVVEDVESGGRCALPRSASTRRPRCPDMISIVTRRRPGAGEDLRSVRRRMQVTRPGRRAGSTYEIDESVCLPVVEAERRSECPDRRDVASGPTPGLSRMFAGLTSRCTRCSRCAQSSAAATPVRTWSARPGGSRPPARPSASSASCPSTYCMVSQSWPASAPRSSTETMFGCERRATTSASRSNRAANDESADSSGRSSLSASWRGRRGWRTR